MEIQIVMPNGLELPVKNELKNQGFEQFQVRDGHIQMECSYEEMLKLNMTLRTADRIYVILKRFMADSFETLFEGVKDFPWEDWLLEDANFMVQGKSKNSQLFSVRNCQSIVEKAVVERLKSAYDIDWFLKTGPRSKIYFVIENDEVTLMLDASGEGLHKRGYRVKTVEAPLRETMAAALLDLSFWSPKRTLYDPFCGSGTIAIEAAMRALHIFPGFKRRYDCEFWKKTKEDQVTALRKELTNQIDWNQSLDILASDEDKNAILSAQENAAFMGLQKYIRFQQRDFLRQEENLPTYGVMLTNPPYGNRLSDADIGKIYEGIRRFMKKRQTWSFYLITADLDLEKTLNQKADRRRKLFNGNILTYYYQFYGPKPKETPDGQKEL